MIHKHDKHNQRKHRKMERRLERGGVNQNCKWWRNLVKRENQKELI